MSGKTRPMPSIQMMRARVSKRRSEQSRGKAAIKKLARKPFGPWEKRDISIHHPDRVLGLNWREDCYLNNRYSVQISDQETSWGTVVHLWICRHDATQPRAWMDLQRIKNELIGEDRIAVEVFPAENNFKNSANMAHLWVLPEGMNLPFTL